MPLDLHSAKAHEIIHGEVLCVQGLGSDYHFTVPVAAHSTPRTKVVANPGISMAFTS
jgi:hypothetical protein